MEDRVYQPPTSQSLRVLISHESQLRCTWEELEYGVHICRVTNGECTACISFGKANVCDNGQGEARCRKYKRPKLGGGQAYDRSAD
jgi:hypothetical protein